MATVGGKEWGFPKMCFRMRDLHEYQWYVIDDEKTVRKNWGLTQTLRKSLPPTPKPCFGSACTAIDNTIFVLGGAKADGTITPSTGPKFGDVFFIRIDDADNHDSEIGRKRWRRGRYLHRTRESPYALNFNGRLLVMSDQFKPGIESVVRSFVELWDADKKCWEQLTATIPPCFSPKIVGHAVLNDGRILFHESCHYDVDAGKVQIYKDDFGKYECSAFVDGILYTLSATQAGLMGFDAYDPQSSGYHVKLSKPQPDDSPRFVLPEGEDLMWATIVALGNHCLGVLWQIDIPKGVGICCSRWKMSKKKEGKRKLVGRLISSTRYRIYGYTDITLEDCCVLGPMVATNGHAKKLDDDEPTAPRRQKFREYTSNIGKE